MLHRMTHIRFKSTLQILAAALLLMASLVAATDTHDGDEPTSRNKACETKHQAPDPTEKPQGSFNIPLDTFGGMQFWTDFFIRGGWRIQRNAMTGHYRLLDGENVRRAWGNYAFCLQELNRLVPTDLQAADRDHAVVLLHGLGRSRACWRALAAQLEKAGDRVVTFGYASTRGSLSDHAFALDHVLRHLEGCKTVSFVGHSLGNLVVRHYLDEHPDPGPGQPGRERMVMLGPPNLGAQMAERLGDSRLFELIAGPSGQELSDRWEDVAPHLATPDFEFGIVAGGADLPITNPLVDGADDLVVSVEETRLPGASDFRHVGAGHTFMPENAEVIALTLQFLKTGCFETPERRQPITDGARLDP
jgi:pimeloyl-ACP methyl ester carboxylesterase